MDDGGANCCPVVMRSLAPHLQQGVPQCVPVCAGNQQAVARIDQVVRPAAGGADAGSPQANASMTTTPRSRTCWRAQRHPPLPFPRALRRPTSRRRSRFAARSRARRPDVQGSPARARRRPAASARSERRKRLGKGFQQQIDPFLRRELGDAQENKRTVRRRPRRRDFAPEKCLAEDIRQILPRRCRILVVKQTGEMRADGNAAVRLLYDAPNQVAFPPAQPALSKARAVLGDDKRDAVSPADRQRQYAGIQAAMCVHQVRPPVFVEIAARQFHPAAGPGQRIAVGEGGFAVKSLRR